MTKHPPPPPPPARARVAMAAVHGPVLHKQELVPKWVLWGFMVTRATGVGGWWRGGGGCQC